MATREVVYSRNWRPREFLLVKLSADPTGLWQHRLLIKRVEGDRWVTAKADRSVQEENVKPGTPASGAKYATAVNWSQNRTLPVRAMRRGDCHLDEDDAKGVFTPEEVDALVKKFHPARGARLAELGVTLDMKLGSREPPEGCKWVAVSEGDGFDMSIKLGDVVTLEPNDVVVGDKAIHFTSHAASKGTVFCEAVKDADVANFRKAFRAGLAPVSGDGGTGSPSKDKDDDDDERGDARLLPGTITYRGGVRHRAFAEAVEACEPEIYDDFPVSGGRNLSWLLEYVQRNGGTFEGRQTKWAHENAVDKDEAAYRIHDLAGRALEVGLCYDQLDITNSAMAELIGRMYSLVEETGGSMQMEGVEYFVGRDEGASRTAVAPGLRKHQSDKLERDVNVAKNQRKAREELAGLPRGPKAPKGPKGQQQK